MSVPRGPDPGGKLKSRAGVPQLVGGGGRPLLRSHGAGGCGAFRRARAGLRRPSGLGSLRFRAVSGDTPSDVGRSVGERNPVFHRAEAAGSDMAKRLTNAFVKTAPPGRHYDEHGLMLRVWPTGAKNWIWRGTVLGRRVDLGLGAYPYTSLAEARRKAFENRRLARAGGDPRAAVAESPAPTFEQALEEVLAIQRVSWRPGGRSEAQWRASLRTYAFPRLGRMRVDHITTRDVMAVLLPIWGTRRETARRVRQRIGAVMKWAVANGYRGDNPADDAIAAALPQGGGREKHFRALPHAQVPAAIAKVRDSGAGIAARLAIEFLVLTAARSGEGRGGRWWTPGPRHGRFRASARNRAAPTGCRCRQRPSACSTRRGRLRMARVWSFRPRPAQ